MVLFAEMNHNPRVVFLDGRDHLDAGIRQWTGDSRGHWEGDTLVVETTNFLRETNFMRGGDDAESHPDRALHPRRRRHAAVRRDRRRPDRVDAAVDLLGSDAEERGAGVRVRVSRGQLRPLQHPRRRGGGGLELGTRSHRFGFPVLLHPVGEGRNGMRSPAPRPPRPARRSRDMTRLRHASTPSSVSTRSARRKVADSRCSVRSLPLNNGSSASPIRVWARAR